MRKPSLVAAALENVCMWLMHAEPLSTRASPRSAPVVRVRQEPTGQREAPARQRQPARKARATARYPTELRAGQRRCGRGDRIKVHRREFQILALWLVPLQTNWS